MLILLINLNRRPDRLAFMTAQLRALALPFERIEAIDGLSDDFGPDTTTITGIERACALSHLKAWQHFFKSGEARCLILEDDMILSSKLKRFIDRQSKIPKSVELLRLETRLVRSKLGRRLSLYSGLKIHRMYSTHAGCGGYVMSRSFAEAAIQDIKSFDDPVDHVIFGASEPCFYSSAAYQLRPALCIQAELFDETKGSAVAASDLEWARQTRSPAAQSSIVARPKRSAGAKVVREIARLPHIIIKAGVRIYENRFASVIVRDVPFAGPVLPVVSSALSVHRSEQALQSAVQNTVTADR